ncbi:unnamed protein product [Polarella glacialis]|uniref:Uncharacterized protein n=1 Tax=Polarella glacialis TaxID=89957 RepID=A0A813H0F0_POLGL|nr:unnamed protein product [Polarella glacialis]CAE8732587.1 unnamed protein product [Polarella glacialis]
MGLAQTSASQVEVCVEVYRPQDSALGAAVTARAATCRGQLRTVVRHGRGSACISLNKNISLLDRIEHLELLWSEQEETTKGCASITIRAATNTDPESSQSIYL